MVRLYNNDYPLQMISIQLMEEKTNGKNEFKIKWVPTCSWLVTSHGLDSICCQNI